MNINWNDPNFQGFGDKKPFCRTAPEGEKSPQGHRHACGPHGAESGGDAAGGRHLLLCAAASAEFPPGSLYVFVVLLCAVYCAMAILTSGFQGTGPRGYFGFVKKQCKIPFLLAAAMVLVAVVGSVIGWKLIRAGSYRIC